MTRKCLSVICAILALVLAIACTAQAAAVGRFLKVEGQVDLLKGGKLPAVPAQLTAPVEPGDVIRTKSHSRAQVLFVDDTILTLAPESRVAVADYLYDGARGYRRALLQVFQGLAHTLVKRVLNLQEPDFLMQTHTAGLGVRGTEWYTLIRPNSTNIYNIMGLLEVRPSNRQIPGLLLLPARQYTEVHRDRAPGPPRDITPAILAMLARMLETGVTAIPPDISGEEKFPYEVDRPGVPEGIIGPYAPSLPAPPAPQPQRITPGTK